MTANPPTVVYEGMKCPTCSGELYLVVPRDMVVDIFCESCGVLRSIMLTRCRSNNCGKLLFFGGKNGKTPINVRTGYSHFADCPEAPAFRMKEVGL